MKRIIKLSGASLALLFFLAASATTAEAYVEQTAQRAIENAGRASQGMQGGGFVHIGGLLTKGEIDTYRKRKKSELDEMTDEERAEYFKDQEAMRDAIRDEQAAAFEDFLGIDKDELRELRRDGVTLTEILEEQDITETEAEEFLTERAEDKIDYLTEQYDLSDVEIDALLERVDDHVAEVLDHWYN